MGREKVIIKKVERYDPDAIQVFVADAIKILDVKPKPRAFIKPNLVQATRYAEHAYTHPELLRAIFRALKESGAAERILFEDCGLMMPLRYVYRKSGYKKLCWEEGVRFLNLAEAVHDVTIKAQHGQVHDELPIPSILIQDGIRVFVPKLKIHAQTDISGAAKLLIGLIKRSLRLHGHHYDLDRKIVDVLEAYPPDLVIIDGITLGTNGAGCPDPYPLNLLIASRNAVAADALAAHLVGFDPAKITHLRLAAGRGLGPCDLADIEIIGEDIKPLPPGTFAEPEIDSLNPYIRYFEGQVHEGKRCRGGCIGFVAEAIYYINHYRAWRSQEKVNPAARFLFRLLGQEPHQERPRKVGIVVGDYKGDLPEELRANLIFVGDCTRAGDLRPRTHLKGCPVFMSRIVFQTARQARLLNPYLDVMEGPAFIRAFIEEQFMCGWNRLIHPLKKKD
ncbi:hypothetical protein CEE36_02350 [candidate division TA06 bacterium B3_TA06]|uniref:DUF362 domain-containing protein n=1 Tax=candidate division TA06 bacterium B3_TA06 TaxID=2012487 RepID=A0A532V9V3_UNCT6|nr:MAG: hypothetical protein CEE36_02350 [candidate division TA06 bacterium B3_TA06]